MPLTELQCKNAKPKDKPYKLTDAEGMYLLIKTSGQKYWQLAYRFRNRQQLVSLGVYPMVRLSDARISRENAKDQLRKGVNPSAHRQELKLKAKLDANNTFETVAVEWLETKVDGWNGVHGEKIRKRLQKHVFPVISARPIDTIKPLELLDLFRKLEAQGSTEIPHRVQNYCSRIFTYGLLTQRCKDNPCLHLKGTLKAHKVKHYPRIPCSELPEFFSLLNEVSTSEQNKLALKFLLYTFVRQGEMRQAKWADIDWKAAEWRLPAPTTKMKVEHIVPLSTQTLQILTRLKAITINNPHGLILPSQNRQKNPGMSDATLKMVIEKMGYKGRLVPHGFRGMASTHLNETNRFRPDAIERQLAHMPRDQVRIAYNHAQYLPERREMMQYWGNFLESQAPSSKVIVGKFGNVA